MPSERLRLERSGFSAATAYDFDRSVAMLGRVIDNKLKETVKRHVSKPPDPPKGMVVEHVPKYTLRQLLYDVQDDGEDERWREDDTPAPDALQHLPTSFL